MANKEQMVLLKQGSQSWNAWRAAQTGAAVNLSGGALRGLDLEGVDLSSADLRDADLRGVNLRSANLTGAHLEGANLFKAILNDADLYEANLSGVRFLQCPQLESAQNWQSAYRDEGLACGSAIPSS